MASSSSSSHFHRGKSGVFISFRGMDVQHGFLSNLTKQLSQKLVNLSGSADERFESGEEISSALVNAIEGSMISLVIFSPHYASSRWCLNELVKIMECNKVNNQIVIPVFYNIDPTDVSHQKGTYGDAFAEFEHKYHSMDKVQSWRSALNQAANLSGYHYPSNFERESELIDQIVKDVLSKLDADIFVDDSTRLVGFDGHFSRMKTLLETELQQVKVIGIWGMGGIGKTALAQAIYNKFSSKFESCCFMENVREESVRYGLSNLRSKLYRQLFDLEEEISDYGVASHIMRKLSRTKVLIVLDDVDTSSQLERLVGPHIFDLGCGSRVIVTSRDRHVFKVIGVHAIHEIGELNSKESLELFSLYAFSERHPIRGYEELSKSVVLYAKGIPLALKVLGMFMHSRDKKEWEHAVIRLQKHPMREIQSVLRLSYDGLCENERAIFLDIAFFFREHPNEDVRKILNACGFYGTIGIDQLLDKALITISDDGKIKMHDLIQQMGEEIVREESLTYPGRRCRLNDLDDLYDMLRKNKGTKSVEGITLDLSQIRDLCLMRDTFVKMPNLRILMFYSTSLNKRSNVKLPYGLETISNKLRYLRWDGYPLASLPSTFCAEKLVELHMEGSHVKFLWNGVQDLFNLRKVYLSESKLLIELPDFSRAPKLEIVDLSYCESLSSLHPSILYLPMLASLNLEGCQELRSLQSEIHLKHLTTDLNLANCFNLEDFSVSSQKVVLPNLTSMNLHGCKNLTVLPEFGGIPNLKRLDLEGCIGLSQLPQSLQICTKLEFLNLKNCTSLVSIPNSLFGFPGLEFLNLAGCSKLAQCLDFDNWRSSIEVRLYSLFHYDGNNKKFGFW